MYVVQAALVGAHCATLPLNVLRQLVKHPLTDLGMVRFLEDHKKALETSRCSVGARAGACHVTSHDDPLHDGAHLKARGHRNDPGAVGGGEVR
jgi:hypothetical protein